MVNVKLHFFFLPEDYVFIGRVRWDWTGKYLPRGYGIRTPRSSQCQDISCGKLSTIKHIGEGGGGGKGSKSSPL